MAGLYFEEFVVGHEFHHEFSRTVTEMDNTMFSLLTQNPQPLHLDAEYMKSTEYGQILVNSCFTLGLMVGISVNDTTQGTAIANLGWNDIRMTHPLFAGDTLYAASEVLGKRESASRPNAGIVTVRTTGTNQKGDVVCTFERIILVAKQGYDVEEKAGY